MSFRISCVLLVAAGIGLTAFGGCHRGFYRRQADAEAAALIAQKSCDPRWSLEDNSIEIDPRSRMFDPFSLDHPPIPPDDPTSHQLMNRVDGKAGYRHWHSNGDTSFVENPEWLNYLPINTDGVVQLDLETAVELALLHSPDYQQQRETLYLSALDVSIQRFGFDAQLFSGFNGNFNTQGPLAAGGSSTTISGNNGNRGLELQRLGTTGSTLIVGLANSLLWQLAGPNTQTATTLLDFSIVQPLLRGGGRDRILEGLTQSERTLLANVRQMERFRRGFYLQVVTGRNAGQGPSLGGNFLGNPGQANTGAGGFLGLLNQQQQIRIQEYNVYSLKNVLEQLQEFLSAERIDSLQVAQAETQLYRSQNQLLSQKVGYQSSLDTFKISIGLPPDLPIEINDPILDQFELIDDINNARQIEIDALKKEVGNRLIVVSETINKNIFQIGDMDKVNGLKWNDEVREAVSVMKDIVGTVTPLVTTVRDDDTERVKKDFEKLRSIREDRIADLKELRQLILDYSGNPEFGFDKSTLANAGEDVAYDPESASALNDVAILERVDELEDLLQKLFDRDFAKLSKEIEELGGLFVELENQADVTEADTEEAKAVYVKVKDKMLDYIPQALTDIGGLSLEISLLQARAKTDSISLPKVGITAEEAIRIAREFRRDWMNARASLVDQWRQIEIAANDLESTLDVVFDGSVGNFGSNPFSIRAETATLRAGLQFDSPIVRQSERNVYRQRLIQYQQTKRQYYQFEDEIKRNLRNVIRQLVLRRIQFETNRRNIKVSVRQVEQARLVLENPGSVESVGRINTLGATATRDITGAIQGLQGAQNSFLADWVTSEVLRRSLDFDLGTMEITQDGFWVDPVKIDADIAMRTAARYGLECDPLFDYMAPARSIDEDSAAPDSDAGPGNSIIEPAQPSDGRPMPASPDDAVLSSDYQRMMNSIRESERNAGRRTAKADFQENPIAKTNPFVRSDTYRAKLPENPTEENATILPTEETKDRLASTRRALGDKSNRVVQEKPLIGPNKPTFKSDEPPRRASRNAMKSYLPSRRY